MKRNNVIRVTRPEEVSPVVNHGANSRVIPMRRRMGVSLVVPMIVVGMGLAIVAVMVLSDAHRNECISNLKTIDYCKALVETRTSGTNTVRMEQQVWQEVKARCPAGLKCPSGGQYDVGAYGVEPTCTVGRHKIPTP